MYAITIPQPGGPEALVWTEVPDPTAGPGEVVIDVVASAVNRADLLQRAGKYPPPAGAPPYPGLECTGRIAAVGEGGTGWQTGDAVCALLSGGGYAQKVVVLADHCLPIPATVSVEDAAALPEVACTVWSNVFELAGLRGGETILIHGGGSGIGTFAIQLATAWGARVLTTAHAAKHEKLRELGAQLTIDYSDGDFVTACHEATDGRGVDVVLDIMGASYLDRNIKVLAPNGRLSIVGTQGGNRTELNLSALMAKRGQIIATTLRARPAAEKSAIVAAVREQVWPLIAAEKIRPVIHTRIPMADAAEAHRIVAASQNIGKVLLTT